jgi:hypothetical protein
MLFAVLIKWSRGLITTVRSFSIRWVGGMMIWQILSFLFHKSYPATRAEFRLAFHVSGLYNSDMEKG